MRILSLQHISKNYWIYPWDEYLAMDDELERENPAHAPDAQHYLMGIQLMRKTSKTIMSQSPIMMLLNNYLEYKNQILEIQDYLTL